jgi:hypothetical protein
MMMFSICCVKVRQVLETVVTYIQSAVWYVVIVVLLALFSFGFLIYELFGEPSAAAILLGEQIDIIIAYIFLVDFFLGLFFNRTYQSRREYWRFNWPDFVSSVPISSEITQLLRVLRLWRALRVLKIALDLWSAKKQISVYKQQKSDFDSSR